MNHKPRYTPKDGWCFGEDPAAKFDPPEEENPKTLGVEMAGTALLRINEWISRGRGHARTRALRADLVLLTIFPQFLPCSHPTAAWVAAQHGVTRSYASKVQLSFTREIAGGRKFRGQKFRKRPPTKS